jgi:hypothetical protein
MKIYYLAIGLILISAISCSFMQAQSQVRNKLNIKTKIKSKASNFIKDLFQ